jgi:NAD-dependent deacetylase
MSSIEAAANLLLESETAVALTGAGISKASGVPTYRDSDGLWQDVDLQRWSLREAFDEDPAGWYANFWRFYNMRRGLPPSLGHQALRDMVEASVIDIIVTQNIDGLDQRAGTPASKILEVHGHDRSLSCTRVEECDFTIPTEEWLAANDPTLLPTCPADDAPLKPDTILFNDVVVPEHVARDWHAAWEVIDQTDMLLVVGTTLEVITWEEAVRNFDPDGKKNLAVINPNPTKADHIADVVVSSPAEEALPEIRDLALNQS